MEHNLDLPCPRCGSAETLGGLRRKRDEVRKRLALEAKPRYPEPPSRGTKIIPQQLANMSGAGAMSLVAGNGLNFFDGSAGELTICAADPNEMAGTVSINDALLDVCIECGTFYATNAKRLGEELLDEIHRMDPLGALAEIGETAANTLG